MFACHIMWGEGGAGAPVAARLAASLRVGWAGGVGQWQDGRMAVAACVASRAAERGWRPARGASGELVLFTGYLTNGDALRAELGHLDLRDDAALYAAALARWGDAVEQQLVGEYAALVCGGGTVRLVASPIGAPPLHYWTDQDQIVVASSARTVLASGLMAREIDEQKIADSLFLNYRDAKRGWFKGISRLGKGERISLTPRGETRTRYYDLHSLPTINFARDDDYVDAANDLFGQAVRAVTKGFANPSVSLSGGYDSQAVAAYTLASLPPGQRLLGLTSVPEPGWDGVAPEGMIGDEAPYVTALAAMHPALDVEWITASGLSFDHKLRDLFLLAGVAPRNGTNLHWIHDLCSRAKALGSDLVLTGSMGNAGFSFAGHGAYPDAFSKGRWRWLLRELRAMPQDQRNLIQKFASQVVMPLLPKSLYDRVGRLRGHDIKDPFDGWSPINRDWAREMRVAERAAHFGFDALYQPKRSTHDWRAALAGQPANEGGDIFQAMAAIHGIPMRDPTAWRPFFEFCAGVPDDQYIRGGVTRWLARRMLQGRVPDMTLAMQGRGMQAADWHLRLKRQLSEMRGEIDRLASDPDMARRIDIAKLRAAVDEFPDVTPTDWPSTYRAQLALSRGLTTARFIRFVEGRND